jgi:hypothetical protein
MEDKIKQFLYDKLCDEKNSLSKLAIEYFLSGIMGEEGLAIDHVHITPTVAAIPTQEQIEWERRLIRGGDQQ